MPNTYKITVNRDSKIEFTLKGAGGGDGGSDARHTGAAGSPGDRLKCSIDALAGEEFYISVGTAGGNGSNDVRNGGGGSAGYALDGFSGGAGGNAGPSGYSGAGGGGGGATVLYKYVNNRIKYLAAAAGGAGGGGAGNYSNGDSFQPVTRVAAYYKKYYPNSGSSSSRASAVLKNYGVQNGSGTYYLTYHIWSSTTQNCVLYSSADDRCTIYVNDSYIAMSAGWTTTSTHNITLIPGVNKLSFTVVNTGGATGYGAYIANSAGSIIWTTRSEYNFYDYFYYYGRGGQGQANLSDGGGGGGGGGGYLGGAGGISAGGGWGGDYGGKSGYPGVSVAMDANALLANQAIASNARLSDWGSVSGSTISILGGSPKNTNGSWSATTLSSSINVKQSGKFRSVYDVMYKSGSEWVQVKEIYTKSNGEWVPLFSKDDFIYTEIAYTQNNSSGYIFPYAEYPTYSYGGDSDGGPSDGSGDSCSDSNGGSCSW